MRKLFAVAALAAMGSLGLGGVSANPGDPTTSDLAKMTTDGYVVMVSQQHTGPALLPTPSGEGFNRFTGGILRGNSLQPLVLDTLTQKPLLHVSVFMEDWAETQESHHFSTFGGGHGGLDQALPSVSASNDRFTFDLPATFGGRGAWVTVWAAVQGYPTECSHVIESTTCDGGALGFYNPLKWYMVSDALDGVPFTTILA